MLDDAAVFLRRAGHEAWHVDESDDWKVECVAEADKASRLGRALDIQTAGHHQGLIGNDADRRTVHSSKADDNVFGKIRLYFEEIAVIDCLEDQFLDVVGFVGVDVYKRQVLTLDLAFP